MTEHFVESLTQKEIEERFKNLFGIEMTAGEREAFFLLRESNEEKAGD
jgi:hypothetical protein